MRFWLGLVVATWCGFASPALAQLPDAIRTATLTREQQTELNRRLNLLQSRLGSLAQETALREAALRNVAVEIYGAEPDLEYEAYVSLIERGARDLRDYLSQARARSDTDASVAAIRQRAIAAAEEGRLSEARSLYGELIAANRNARQRARAAEDLADASDMAEAAQLAFVAGDYLEAARLVGEAASLAPEGSRERLQYMAMRADALWMRASLYGDEQMLPHAAAAFEDVLRIWPPDEDGRRAWAGMQLALGSILVEVGKNFSDAGALSRAVTAFEAALTEITREFDPPGWAQIQLGLGEALKLQGDSGVSGASARAVVAYEAALTVMTRQADPVEWADLQMRLGAALFRAGEQGAPALYNRAAAAYEAALTVIARDTDLEGWTMSQYSLAHAYRASGRTAEARAAAQAALDAYEQSGDQYWAWSARTFIAGLPTE